METNDKIELYKEWLKEVEVSRYTFTIEDPLIQAQYYVNDVETGKEISLETAFDLDMEIETKEEFHELVFALYLHTVMHEAGEMFRVNDKQPYHPHAGSGRSFLYTIQSACEIVLANLSTMTNKVDMLLHKKFPQTKFLKKAKEQNGSTDRYSVVGDV